MKTPKHYNAVKELLAVGKSYTECARQLGVSRQRVHQIAVKTGLEKIWKEKEPCQYYVKKHAFMLGPDLYQECKNRFRRKVQNCKDTKTPFLVEFDDLEWPLICPVLGIELDYYGMLGSRNPASVSFDRVDSSLGYIPGNVHIISWKANRIKNDGTAEEHRKIADYIYKHDKKNL